jgi:surfeit locus 1 family protein
LLGLGTWQVTRLNWKQTVIAQIDARVDADPVVLPDQPDATRDKYLAVAVKGQMLPDEVHVLVSKLRVGAGYLIIAAFETDDGRRILVDRGFTRSSNKNAERAIGEMQIDGNLHWPDEIDAFTPKPELTSNIWFARDVPAMAKALDTEQVLLVARVRTDPGVTPFPIDSSAIPNDHLQYAITWFLLAAVWASMTLFFIQRTKSESTTT